MTNEQAKAVFEKAIEAHRADGDRDGVARCELLREYFTNTEFRGALTEFVFSR